MIGRWFVYDQRRLSALRAVQPRHKDTRLLPGSASRSPRQPTHLRPHHSHLHLYPAVRHIVRRRAGFEDRVPVTSVNVAETRTANETRFYI